MSLRATILSLWLTHFSTKRNPGSLYPVDRGTEFLWREGDRSLHFSAEVKGQWSCESAPPYAFIACTGTILSLPYSISLDAEQDKNIRCLKVSRNYGCTVTSKLYINPITGLDRPRGFQEIEAPRFQDNRHMKVVRLSALRTGRLYILGNIPGTHFCWSLSLPQGHSAAGRITSMKDSYDTIGTFGIVARCLNQLR
jgi:hypothetical protein